VTALPLRIATPTWAPLRARASFSALPAQQRDDALLLLRGDAAEDGRGGYDAVKGGVVEAVEAVEAVELRAGDGWPGIEPGPGGQRGDGARVVAGEDLQGDPVTAEARDRLGDLAAPTAAAS
jgi:hypothetical protein